VAIARALVKSSRILFADEPTGSLDKKTGEEIMNLIAELNREGLTVVMVTHDPQYAKLAHRSVTMEDGAFV
jgi:ABC-type lipoprotein export system ATPase subunit